MAPVAACAVILGTLIRVQPVGESKLLALCRLRSLRGGALDFAGALEVARSLRLVRAEGSDLSLSDLGVSLTALVAASDEPTAEFVEVLQGLVAAVVSDSQPTTDAAPADASPIRRAMSMVPSGADNREALGDLAERLSMRHLVEGACGPGNPVRVSLVSPRYGFDILFTRPTGSATCYEAKGTSSGGDHIVIFVSRHEITTARELGGDYALMIWGGLRLAEDPNTQYSRLVSSGFPWIIPDPASVFADCWNQDDVCVTDGAQFSVATTAVRLRAATY